MAKKEKHQRICTMCKKTYIYCNRGCEQSIGMEPWHDAYCSENCKDLYNICAGYVNHWMEPDIEAARLAKMDLSYVDKLPEWMRNAIHELQKIDVKYADAINTVLEEKVEELKIDVDEDKSEKPDVVAEEQHTVDKNEKPVKKMNTQNKYKSNKYSK